MFAREPASMLTLQEKLSTIHCLEELEGFANRRKYLPSLPKWTEEERGLILARKYELERNNVEKKKK